MINKPDSIARRFARAIAKCACREGEPHDARCDRFTNDIESLTRRAMTNKGSK